MFFHVWRGKTGGWCFFWVVCVGSCLVWFGLFGWLAYFASRVCLSVFGGLFAFLPCFAFFLSNVEPGLINPGLSIGGVSLQK